MTGLKMQVTVSPELGWSQAWQNNEECFGIRFAELHAKLDAKMSPEFVGYRKDHWNASF